MKILAPEEKGAARAELQKVSGVASSTIASEAPKDDAFIVYGSGPQIRVYCIFGDDAITGDGVPSRKGRLKSESQMQCKVEA
jgi:hypothetical protein